MVAAACLLEPLEVGVEVVLAEEGGAVDPRELRVVLVAAPVGAREARELDRLDRPRVLQVRAAAEVGEVALRVEGDRAVGGVDELDLVVLALLGEEALRLLGRDLAALPDAALGELLADLLLDPLPARPRRSARGTRSRSRSRSRSAGRSRSSSPGRAGGPPRRAGARPSGAGRRARRDRPCRGWSGSGSAGRPRAAARRSCTCPFERSRTACSASLGPIARAASRPVDTVGEFEFARVGKDDLHGSQGY